MADEHENMPGMSDAEMKSMKHEAPKEPQAADAQKKGNAPPRTGEAMSPPKPEKS